MRYDNLAAGERTPVAIAVIANDERFLRLEERLDLSKVGRISIVYRFTQVAERRPRHLARVVEHTELAADLRGLFRVEHERPAIRRDREPGLVIGQAGQAGVVGNRID